MEKMWYIPYFRDKVENLYFPIISQVYAAMKVAMKEPTQLLWAESTVQDVPTYKAAVIQRNYQCIYEEYTCLQLS